MAGFNQIEGLDDEVRLSDIYRDAVTTRNTELQALWSRFNLYLALNSGFLAAYVAAGDGSYLDKYKALGPGIGLVLVMAWGFSEYFGRWALKYRDDKVRELEALWPPAWGQHFHLYLGMPWHFSRQQVLSAVVITFFGLSWLWIVCVLNA